MGDSKNLVVNRQGDVMIASFMHSKLLDETNIHAIGVELLALVDQNKGLKLIIDFTTVTYLSSAVLGKLMAIHKGVSATKGILVLCGITPNILEVFKITKLDKLFTIESDVKNAVKTIEKKKSGSL
mgnify:CR=1 FL=1